MNFTVIKTLPDITHLHYKGFARLVGKDVGSSVLSPLTPITKIGWLPLPHKQCVAVVIVLWSLEPLPHLSCCLSGGSSLHTKVQRTRRHKQLWRLRRGGCPCVRHRKVCEGVFRILARGGMCSIRSLTCIGIFAVCWGWSWDMMHSKQLPSSFIPQGWMRSFLPLSSSRAVSTKRIHRHIMQTPLVLRHKNTRNTMFFVFCFLFCF